MCCLLSQLSARWPKGGANQSAAALAVSSAKRRRRRRRSGKKRPACVYSWESLRVVQSVRTTTGSSSSLSRSSPTAHFFFVVVSFFSQKKEEKENIYNSSRLSLCVCVRESAWACSPPETYHHPRLCLCSRFSVCVCFFFFSSRHFFFFWILLPPFSTRAPLLLQEKLGVSSSLQRGRLLEAIFFFFCLKDIFIFGWRHVAVLNPDFSFSSFWVSTTFWKKQKTNRSKRVCVLFARPPPGLLASRSIFSAVEKSSRCNPMLSGQIWNQQPCRRTFAVHFVDREREDTHTAPKSFLSSCTFLVAADGGKAFRVRWPAIITCFSLLSNFEAKFSLKKK